MTCWYFIYYLIALYAEFLVTSNTEIIEMIAFYLFIISMPSN